MKELRTKEEEFCMFFHKMKELFILAKELKFGSGIVLNSIFTQELCKHLYSLSDYQPPENAPRKRGPKPFDAQEGDKTVEIKATISADGQTRINMKAKFDIIYWLYFNMDTELLTVRRMDGDRFRELFKGEYEKKDLDKKHSVSLRKVYKKDYKEEVIKFEKNKIVRLGNL